MKQLTWTITFVSGIFYMAILQNAHGGWMILCIPPLVIGSIMIHDYLFTRGGTKKS